MTKNLLAIAAFLALAGFLCCVRAQAPVESGTSGSTVSGQVRVVEEKSGKLTRDSSGVAVWLAPLGNVTPARLDTSKQAFRIVQHDKQFHPHLLIVPIGSTVRFPNLDPWFHNVFSLYRGKRFDLGLYEAGSEKAVRFDRLGPSYIFCNIHPEMMAVVLTVDTTFYTLSDKDGHWSIPGVADGRYRLHVWNENASPAALKSLERDIEVAQGSTPVAPITVPVTPHEWSHHSNLYGRPYDTKQLAPVY